VRRAQPRRAPGVLPFSLFIGADAERQAGCGSTLTQAHYRDLLRASGFTDITITSTHQAGPGLHSVIIQAVKPATRNP
jgi:hypothetical protein